MLQPVLAFACNPHHNLRMPQARKSAAPPRRSAGRVIAPAKPAGKVAITLRLDADRVRRLQAIAEAENRTLTNYVETALLRDLARREEADRVITMYVPEGASTSILPDDVVRAEGESDEEHAERQALTVELWSIPHNA
jgi:predicted transcriptional regulator